MADAAHILRGDRVLDVACGTGVLVESATHRGTVCFPGIRAMVEADLRWWLPAMGVTLPEEQVRQILEEAVTLFEPYVDEQGRVLFDASGHIVTGTRPYLR